MRQNMDTSTRRRAAYIWSNLLLGDPEHIHDFSSELGKILKDLAEESHKRINVAKRGSGRDVRKACAWYVYFIAAFEKILRELPPPDSTIEQIREESRGFKLIPAPFQHGTETQTAANKKRGKRPATDMDDYNAGNIPLIKRARKESDADNFFVYIPANVKVIIVPEGPADPNFMAEGSTHAAASTTTTTTEATVEIPASPTRPSMSSPPSPSPDCSPTSDCTSSTSTSTQDQEPSPAQPAQEENPNSFSLSVAGYEINIPSAMKPPAHHTSTPSQNSQVPTSSHEKAAQCNIRFGLYSIYIRPSGP